MTTPLTPERLREIAASHQRQTNALAVDHPVDLQERCDHRAISELLAEIARLQSAVLRLANNERDLAETDLVLEQQDRDLERQRARIAALETALREACDRLERYEFDEANEIRLRAVADAVESRTT